MNKMEKRIIGSYYKNYRKRKNLTIKEVSVLAHLSHAAISEFENGKTKPSQETIRHIIKCYGIEFDLSADYIIEREAKLNKLVELYCLHDFDSFVQVVDKIRENIKYRDSYFYPLFLLCEYYHAISSETESNMNNGEIIMLTGEIGNCYDSFFENEKL